MDNILEKVHAGGIGNRDTGFVQVIDSCDAGADAVMLPIADGGAGFLLCRSEEAAETGEACVPVCGIGFSALPLCAGIGRCEAR